MCKFVEKSWFLIWYIAEHILAVTLYQILKVILGNSQWDIWDPELQSLRFLGLRGIHHSLTIIRARTYSLYRYFLIQWENGRTLPRFMMSWVDIPSGLKIYQGRRAQGNREGILRPDGILNFTSVRRCMFSVSFHVTMFQCWDNFTSFIVDMNRDSVISLTLGATHHRAITDHWQLFDNLTLTTYYNLLFRIGQKITFTGWMNNFFSLCLQ